MTTNVKQSALGEHCTRGGFYGVVFCFVMMCQTAFAEQAPPSEVEFLIKPAEAAENLSATQAHYRYQLVLSPGSWDKTEVVVDPRLLRLEVRGEKSRAKLRCAHPRPLRKQPEGKYLRVLQRGQPESTVELAVDLRMYCRGRAFKRLQEGGEIQAYYGWKGRSRKTWVARSLEVTDAKLRELKAAPVSIEAEPPAAEDNPLVDLSMRSVSRTSARGMVFAVTLKLHDQQRFVYVRPDQFRFLVRGMDQQYECGVQNQTINPIRDFFVKISKRRAVRKRLEAAVYCEDVFSEGGVYEVQPIVDLPYDGKNAKLDALTGSYTGRMALVRIYKGQPKD